MKPYSILALLAAVSFSQAFAGGAQAIPIPELGEYLDEELALMDEVVTLCSPEPSADSAKSIYPSKITSSEQPQDRFLFRNFWVRARPRAGFQLPGIVTIQVIPEVEMLFQKQMPEGWGSYKPLRSATGAQI